MGSEENGRKIWKKKVTAVSPKIFIPELFPDNVVIVRFIILLIISMASSRGQLGSINELDDNNEMVCSKLNSQNY